MAILTTIEQYHQQGRKALAILVDPDKPLKPAIRERVERLRQMGLNADVILSGGSTGCLTDTSAINEAHALGLPVLLFPGNDNQLTNEADAVLLPSVISGRNAEMLIGAHVKAARQLKAINLEIIPLGYILIDGGTESSVIRVSNTLPIRRENEEEIVNTAIAGQLLGKRVIYLEAGSGALYPVCEETIRKVREMISIPLMVGGGIRTKEDVEKAWKAGADMVVIGNGLE